MIIDIPREADYEKTALDLLNLAWESVLKLAVELDEAKDYGNDVAEDIYWNACQSQLATAASLVQQGFEFLLKGKIIAVSPYLLISGTPRDWPKGCTKADTPFAKFYSIDAQDLVRVHDTVANNRLPEKIVTLFEDMRTLRNSIMHTVDSRLKVEVKQVVCAILEISGWSTGPFRWIETRRMHIRKSPNAIAYEYEWGDYETHMLVRDVIKAVEILTPAEVRRFFDFDKNQRRYICPSCSSDCGDSGLHPKLAFLKPNTSTSTNLHCYLCDKDFTVIRKDCTEEGCKGNVLNDDDDRCLTCYERPCVTPPYSSKNSGTTVTLR